VLIEILAVYERDSVLDFRLYDGCAQNRNPAGDPLPGPSPAGGYYDPYNGSHLKTGQHPTGFRKIKLSVALVPSLNE
jgi:hypothetical protein